MSTSAIGNLQGVLHDFVHAHAPHTPAEFYLLSLMGAVIFAALGKAISLYRRRRAQHGNAPANRGHTEVGSTIAYLGSGSSFVIFVIMPLVPFDEDLLLPLNQSWLTVALAGIIGAGITLRSLWGEPDRSPPVDIAPWQDNVEMCPPFSVGTKPAENRVPLFG